MRRKKKQESHDNHERWLLTYSDLITLLMIFFVIMYAMSSVDVVKYRQVADSLKVTMGGGKSIVGSSETANILDDVKAVNDAANAEKDKLKEVKKSVDTYLDKNGLKSSVTTSVEERGLVISLNDTLLFDTGKADVKPEAKKKLVEIGKILTKLNNYVRVEGHTDIVPISNYEFKSNWQLSAIRATNVTEILISDSGMAPQYLTAMGYGQYRPIADNDSEAGKAKNRRVDIIVLDSKFNQVENNKKK